MKLAKQETQLIGKWVDTETGAIADEVSERIRWLIANYLIKLATDETGWGRFVQRSRGWQILGTLLSSK